MKLFSLLLALMIAGIAQAMPLELRWDAVTKDEGGNPISAPKYRLYRKTSLEDFKPIAETANTRWTWLVPSLGRASYYVTAFNENGESEPSNIVNVIVERIPREDK